MENSGQLWQFSVRGCFKEKIAKEDTKIQDTKIFSLLELTLRVVYGLCYLDYVTRKNKIEYKRVPRCSNQFGKWLFQSENLPKILVNMLKKGPKAFCCWCTKGLFKEAICQEFSVKMNLRDQPEEDPKTLMHFCSHQCSQQGATLLQVA